MPDRKLPRQLTSDDIEGITDPYERTAGLALLALGYMLFDVDPIVVQGKKSKKSKRFAKRCTVPDLFVALPNSDPLTRGVWIEVTRTHIKSHRKQRQRKVMAAVGLSDRYMQIAGEQIPALSIPESNVALELQRKLRYNS